MASFNRKNLVILDENEINFNNSPAIGLLILLKPLSAHVHIDIDHSQIQAAIQEQTGIFIEDFNISKYLSDYVVVTRSLAETKKIIKNEWLKIMDHLLPILPYTPGYGSIEVDLDAQIPNRKIETPAVRHGPGEPLKLSVYGVPPIFWGQRENISKIMRNICYVCDIRVNTRERIYVMLTFASRSAIPEMAHVGVRRAKGRGLSVLNIWPIWITVQPPGPDDLARLNPPPTQRNPLLSYSVFPQGSDDSGAGPSGGGGEAEGGNGGNEPEEDLVVDDAPESSDDSIFDFGSSGSTIVPDSASPEVFSPSLEI